MDFFTNFPELVTLEDTRAVTVKSVFAHHRIPQTVTTDNGLQFKNREFLDFVKIYDFHKETYSPRYGLAEYRVLQ